MDQNTQWECLRMGHRTSAPRVTPSQGQDGLWVLNNYKSFYLQQDRERNHARRSLQAHAKQMREADQSCLMLDNSGRVCGRPSKNRCHLIPEHPILSKLADLRTGKVLELRWSLSAWTNALSRSSRADPINVFSAEMFQPRGTPLEKGTGNATVGHYACKCHDREVFRPIDVARPDFHSRDVMLLTAYRTLLFVADIARGAQALMFDPKLYRLAHDHESPDIRTDWESRKQSPPFSLLKPYLYEFYGIWQNRRTTVSLTGRPIPFRSRLHFAACAFLSNPHQVVSVHPIRGDEHQLIVIQVGPEDPSAKAIRDRLESAALAASGGSSEDIRLVCEILRWADGATVASIESYDSLTGWERRQIQAIVGHNSGARGIYSLLEPKLRNL